MTGPLSAAALLTAGLESCLTASRRPHFGWQLVGGGSDPPASYQGAYQLRLSDAAGMLLWNSGVVPSGDRAAVVLPAGRYTVEGPTPGAAAVGVEPSAGAVVGVRDADAAAVAAAGTVTFRIHPGTWHFRPE